jgi:hypothetical protein
MFKNIFCNSGILTDSLILNFMFNSYFYLIFTIFIAKWRINASNSSLFLQVSLKIIKNEVFWFCCFLSILAFAIYDKNPNISVFNGPKSTNPAIKLKKSDAWTIAFYLNFSPLYYCYILAPTIPISISPYDATISDNLQYAVET